MIFDHDEYVEILNDYGFLNFPRFFGTPSQIEVKTLDRLIHHLNMNDGKYPLYISHNSHNGIHVNYAQMFFDLDGKHMENGLKRSLEDTRQLVEEFYDYDKNISFSGQGFHVLLKFSPKFVRMDEIRGRIREFQERLKNKLNLETLDIKVAEPRRLVRIPLSQYIWNDGNQYRKENRYCIPISEDILFSEAESDILKRSERMEYELNPRKLKKMNIDNLPMSRDEKYIVEYAESPLDINFYEVSEQRFREIVYELLYRSGGDEKLIHNLFSIHPTHQERFIACLKLKNSGLSLNSIISFFDRLSFLGKWDNRNLEIQKNQITQIMSKDYNLRVGRE